MEKDHAEEIKMMRAVVDPWYQSLVNPTQAQEDVLEKLLQRYHQTEYGKEHHSEKVGSYDDYKRAFPVQTYGDFKPYFDQVLAGNFPALLCEPPVIFAFTKGTTGKSKMFPITQTRLDYYYDETLREQYSYCLYKNDFDWLKGNALTFISSPRLGKIKVGEQEFDYGYSAAVFSEAESHNGKTKLKKIPSWEELAILSQGVSTKETWQERYELAYSKASGQNISMVTAMPSNVIGFGRYIYRKYHVYPKDLWQIKRMKTGGYPGVHSHLLPELHALYGRSFDVRDMYISTEGTYGVQMDDKKAWSPFYDHLFFEVQTLDGIKPLYQMYPGEIGSLVVSTLEMPRYRIGDLIVAFEAPYFRCIGRENTQLHPYHFGKLAGRSLLSMPQSDRLNKWR